MLQTIAVNQEGAIVGGFSNGETRELGQVSVARFSNSRGLDRLGSNLWAATPESGTAAIGTANTGGRGSVVSHSLEQSNVDLANEFVKLITIQRGFQANAKTISTADQLMNDVLQLKR
jgi:flagellar hook protein FlgE